MKPSQLPWRWYLKPLALPVGVSLLFIGLFILFIPDPLFTMKVFGGLIGTSSGLYIGPIMFLAYLSQAWVWYVGLRCWRFHSALGVPLGSHVTATALSITLAISALVLLPTILVLTGVRAALQDRMDNPWLPLLARQEMEFCVRWAVLHGWVFLGAACYACRWKSHGQQHPVMLTLMAFCFLMSLIFFNIPFYFSSKPEYGWLYAISLTIGLAILVPMIQQLREQEAL